MADTEFLPVEASARQQLNRRAVTAHNNFIVDNKYLLGRRMTSTLTAFSRMFSPLIVRTECPKLSRRGCPPVFTSRTRPDQHVHRDVFRGVATFFV